MDNNIGYFRLILFYMHQRKTMVPGIFSAVDFVLYSGNCKKFHSEVVVINLRLYRIYKWIIM
jgi:hypothetical protein